jgi:hypothetical protein
LNEKLGLIVQGRKWWSFPDESKSKRQSRAALSEAQDYSGIFRFSFYRFVESGWLDADNVSSSPRVAENLLNAFIGEQLAAGTSAAR